MRNRTHALSTCALKDDDLFRALVASATSEGLCYYLEGRVQLNGTQVLPDIDELESIVATVENCTSLRYVADYAAKNNAPPHYVHRLLEIAPGAANWILIRTANGLPVHEHIDGYLHARVSACSAVYDYVLTQILTRPEVSLQRLLSTIECLGS